MSESDIEKLADLVAKKIMGNSNNDISKKQTLTVKEAAREYGFTESMLRKMIAEKSITYIKNGRAIRLHRKDIDAYLEGSKVRSAS